jgi:hypothetical protein
MSILPTNPSGAAADGQRARVVADAVVSAYIHEIARAGAGARRGVGRNADSRDDGAGVMARAARTHACAGARRTSPRLVAPKPQLARRRHPRVQTA